MKASRKIKNYLRAPKKVGEKTYYGQFKICAVYYNWPDFGDWVYKLETGALLSASHDRAQKRF